MTCFKWEIVETLEKFAFTYTVSKLQNPTYKYKSASGSNNFYSFSYKYWLEGNDYWLIKTYFCVVPCTHNIITTKYFTIVYV